MSPQLIKWSKGNDSVMDGRRLVGTNKYKGPNAPSD